MRVRILLFAALREALSDSAVEVELPAGCTIEQVLTELRAKHPVLGQQRFATALNRRYAEPSETVSEGDELALIPPVSGG